MFAFPSRDDSLGFLMAKVALGKGLGALINTRVASPTPAVESGERVQSMPLDHLVPTPLQPRTAFREENLEELVASIKEHGIIQPLIVRRRGDQFEIIAGERRWRAARKAGLAEVPIIAREASDQDVLELALIENLQREDLNPDRRSQRLLPARPRVQSAPGRHRPEGRQEPRRRGQQHAPAGSSRAGPELAHAGSDFRGARQSPALPKIARGAGAAGRCHHSPESHGARR